MRILQKLSFACTLIGLSFAGQSPRNILNEDNGDFGGEPFSLREEFESFIETDGDNHVTAYGFYMPKLSRMGLESTTSVSGPARGAAMDFDKSGLLFPEEIPFEFIGLNYGPSGHGGNDYNIPHFDVHLWLYPSEYSRGIECNGTTFPPCQTTPWLASRFSNTPSSDFFPPGFVNNPSYWAATGGAHIWPATSDGFENQPAVVVGTYLGKVIYYEPMIASEIIIDSETSATPLNFAWPVMRYPFPGRYFTNIQIEYLSVEERYKISFNQLVVSPEYHRGKPVFVGAQNNPSAEIMLIGSVSAVKDCLINSGDILDGGYMISTAFADLCCRARGTYVQVSNSCEVMACGSPSPLVISNPQSFFYDPVSAKCFSRCIERV